MAAAGRRRDDLHRARHALYESFIHPFTDPDDTARRASARCWRPGGFEIFPIVALIGIILLMGIVKRTRS